MRLKFEVIKVQKYIVQCTCRLAGFFYWVKLVSVLWKLQLHVFYFYSMKRTHLFTCTCTCTHCVFVTGAQKERKFA